MNSETAKKINYFDLFSLALICAAFVYTCLRAYLLSMTHDEALSYIFFDHLSTFQDIVRYTIPTTNNHLLNSFLMKFFTQYFGNSEFVIRLPALVGHALYLTSIYKILKLFLKESFILIGTALLVLQPFLIDYFSCARGYALGLGFMSWGFYFCLRELKNPSSHPSFKNLFFAYLMLAVSALGNLAFLNIFIAVVSFFGLMQLFYFTVQKEPLQVKLKRILIKVILPILPNALFLALVYTEPIKKLRNAHEFYHGGDLGFWDNTVGSLLQVLMYGKTYFHLDTALFSSLLKYLVLAILLTAFLFLFHQRTTRKDLQSLHPYLLFFFGILIICSTGIILQHRLFGTVYPIDRAAIFYIPIFFILALLLWTGFRKARSKTIRITTNFIGLATASAVLYHSISCVNLTHFLLNSPDAHTKEMMQTITEMTKNKNLPPETIRLGVHWWFEPAVNYYILRNHLIWIHPVDRNGPDGVFNYYYLREDDKSILDKYKLNVIKKYEISNTYLAAYGIA